MAVSLDPDIDNPDLRGDHPERLFAIALPYDQDHASDGYSRYGAYLAQERHQFELSSDLDLLEKTSLENAITAWRLARPPIMAPGFVWSARRVINSKLRVEETRDDRNNAGWAIRAAIDIAYRVSTEWASWRRHDWDSDWREPEAEGPVTLCTVHYVANLPLAADSLPPIPNVDDRRALTDWAQDVVGQLVDALNVTFDGVTDTVAFIPGKTSR